MRIMLDLLELARHIVRKKYEIQLWFIGHLMMLRQSETSGGSEDNAQFTGFMARECMLPSALRVTSIPVLAALITVCKSEDEVSNQKATGITSCYP